MKLEFFNVAESALVLESRLTASLLRGFQIKLAALVAIPAHRVLMMDADLLRVKDPCHIITKYKSSGIHAHLFRDFWHFVERRHEKSSRHHFFILYTDLIKIFLNSNLVLFSLIVNTHTKVS